MSSIDTLVIGAGHAGLAVSRCLSDSGIEHVVLERGRVAERWRTARWDSFRLLTPRWLTRLPGQAYQGPEPDGFMTAAELVAYLEAYARASTAPVVDRTTVLEVRAEAGGYRVLTDAGTWWAAHVVIATGYHASVRIPACAARLPAGIAQVTSAGYRGPGQLPDGGVLVVGASASGVQIADELVRAGRSVLLAAGGHTRVPRRYRGRDIFWWLERCGSLDRTIDELPAQRAEREPSLQLSGAGHDVDLGALQSTGVRLTGRLTDIGGGTVRFADDLTDTVAAAEIRLRRLLTTVDECASSLDSTTRSTLDAADPPPPILVGRGPRSLPLRAAGVGAVVWATGLRPCYPWLAVPVLDETGRLRHRRGVTPAPGLYAVGLRFQYRRRSSLIDGARHDAAFVVGHIAARRRLPRPVDH